MVVPLLPGDVVPRTEGGVEIDRLSIERLTTDEEVARMHMAFDDIFERRRPGGRKPLRAEEFERLDNQLVWR